MWSEREWDQEGIDGMDELENPLIFNTWLFPMRAALKKTPCSEERRVAPLLLDETWILNDVLISSRTRMVKAEMRASMSIFYSVSPNRCFLFFLPPCPPNCGWKNVYFNTICSIQYIFLKKTLLRENTHLLQHPNLDSILTSVHACIDQTVYIYACNGVL